MECSNKLLSMSLRTILVWLYLRELHGRAGVEPAAKYLQLSSWSKLERKLVRDMFEWSVLEYHP